MSEYIFRLQSPFLLQNPTTIEISFPSFNLKTSSSCVCSLAGSTCSFGTYNVTIDIPGLVNDSLVDIGINGIINPNSTEILFSEVIFNIGAWDSTNMIFSTMALSHPSSSGTYTYTAHAFGSSSSFLPYKSTTTSITYYRLTLINLDFPIPGTYSMIIVLPTGLKFTQLPILDIVQGFSTPITIPTFIESRLIALNLFKGGVPTNTTLVMDINFIQNPYYLANDLIFTITIYPPSLSNYPYFKDQNEFSVNIDSINTFAVFSVAPHSNITSWMATHNVSFKLREGDLLLNTVVKLTVPDSVKWCDEDSITLVEQGTGCTNNVIPDSKTKFSQYVYGFSSDLCINPGESDIKFTLTCRTPETTRLSGNFTLTALNGTDVYYESTGCPYDMDFANTLPTFSFSMGHEWQNYPNIFTFMFTRNSPIESTDIDQIIISVSNSLSFTTCPSISGSTGMSGTFVMSCSGGEITINSIVGLLTTFSFQLDNINNPTSGSFPITFNTEIGNSEGYIAETGVTVSQYAMCAYPCKLCTTGVPTNCTACFDEDDAVFDGGTSIHILSTISLTGTCGNSCPSHSFILASLPEICSECDANCKDCITQATICTSCYPDTFLSGNECVPNCPEGYTNNEDTWTCLLILGYESGTAIQLLGTQEIEQTAGYKFILRPEVGLPATNSKLEISCSALGADLSCPAGICSIIDFISSDYTSGDPPIIVEINNTFINPELTYFYSEIIFTVKTKINELVYHSGSIGLEGAPLHRYTPHTLGVGSQRLISSHSKTVTHTTLTFNITNTDFPIPIGHKIIITFPSQLTFTTSFLPIFSPLENLAAGSLSSSGHPSLQISGFFADGPLAANSMIRFSINNILTSRELGISESLIINIGNTIYEKQFTLTGGLTVELTQIAQFPAFNVRSGYITSDFDTFEFSVTLGAGMLNTTDKIVFTVPRTVKNCNISTFTAIQGLIIGHMETNEISSNKFSFDVPCYIPNQFKFGIVCQHPETTKVTDNFLISAKIKNSNHIFYESSGSPMTMNILNTFSNIVMTMESEEVLVNNTMNIIVTRTASYDSTDIDEIQITASNTLNMAECSVSIISGINPEIPTVNKSGQQITLGGIISLSKVFEVQLVNVQNPSEHNNIEFGILTAHSDGTQGEEDQTPTLFTLCDYPCRTCSSYDECASCFPPLHPVFSTGPQFYFYVHYLSQCMEECPINYYENSTITCDRCRTTCKECFGIASKHYLL